MKQLEARESCSAEVLEWETPTLMELGTVDDMTQWNGSITVE